MKTKILTLTAAALVLVGCTGTEAPKVLVLYYSQTGSTETVANEIAAQLGVDAVSFDVTTPYTGTYQETIERCGEEMKTQNYPELAELAVNLADYDVIFLGYPIWYGTYANPVAALLLKHSEDLNGKTIVPFCSFGSGGLESSVTNLREALPEATVLDGYGIREARLGKVAGEITEFLTVIGCLEGEVTEYPEYGEEHPVSEEEAAIFNEACGNYPMPLGTPSSVSSRERGDATDYIFTVVNNHPEFGEMRMQLHVTTAPDSPADFVKAVR